jgi:hypothetical protein
VFEYTFHGLEDGEGTFTHTGTTSDFLEVCCQIARLYESQVAMFFVGQLLAAKEKELDFLRVTDWNFEWEWDELTPPKPRKCKIELNYMPR